MQRYKIKHHVPDSRSRIEFSDHLNTEQLAVVSHGNGPMLVLAGAGTGKTTTVTYRVARLIQDGTRPEAILLLTFTNKAAREMMRRAEELIGSAVSGVWGGTFHHLCNMILRRHADAIGYSRSFSIIDREDSRDVIQSCLGELSFEGILPKPAVFMEIIGLAKNTGEHFENVIESRFPFITPILEEAKKVQELYEERKHRLQLMDFDDLLVNTHCLLHSNESICEWFRERFLHVLVDEYQDTNQIQSEIVDILALGHRNLMAVGDDAQSIYSFRGADFENIIRFPERYPDSVMFKLTTNYRSTPEILNLANHSISHNTRQFKKELHSVQYMGEKPGVTALNDVFEQAQYVASRVTDLASEGSSLRNIAILYRSHYQSMEIQMEFQKRGIPFEVRSGLKFFEMAHIKDVLAHLRILVNPYDELSWVRALKLIPGIGNVTARRIFREIFSSDSPLRSVFSTSEIVPKRAMDAYLLFLNTIKSLIAEDGVMTPSDAIEIVLSNGYETYLYNAYPDANNRVDDIHQMGQYALNYPSLEEFIADLSLQSVTAGELTDEDSNDDAVVLSTVHQAKGLEWDYLFIIGLNDGRFPSARALKTDDEEEERRLFYVAVTRAKRGLNLCYTLTGNEAGGVGFLKPSRFLKEIEENLYEKIYIDREW